MSERKTAIIACKVKDYIIQQLKTISQVDSVIKNVIDDLVITIQNREKNTEIFEVGNDYIVTEDCIYIVCYEDELSDDIKPKKDE